MGQEAYGTKVEIKNAKGEVIERRLREIPYSETNGQDYEFSIEDFPDYSCDVEDSVISSVERRDIHKVINQLDAEDKIKIDSILNQKIQQIIKEMLEFILEKTILILMILLLIRFMKRQNQLLV